MGEDRTRDESQQRWAANSAGHGSAETELLPANRRFLSTLMSSLPGMVYRCRNDADCTMLFVSGGCFELTGYHPSDIVMNNKISYRRIIHPKDLDDVIGEARAVMETGRPFQAVYRIVTSAGEEKWVREHGWWVFSDGEEVREGFITDITAQMCAEEELRRSERHYRALFENIGDAVFINDLSGNTLEVNRVACDMLGYSREELLQMTLYDVDAPEYTDMVQVRIEEVRRSGSVFFETVHVTRDGSFIPAEVNSRLIDYGDRQAILSVIRDISGRKKAEEMLRRERDMSSAILRTVGALVVVTDCQGRIVHFNRSCEEMTGYPFEEVKDRYLWDVFLVPEEKGTVRAVFEELKTGSFPNRHENYWLTKEGNRRMIAWSNTVLLDDEGNVSYVIGTGIDVTEQKQAENALRRSEQRFRTLVESIDDVVFTLDREQRHTGVFGRWLEKAGLGAEAFLGKTPREILGEEAAPIHEEANRRALAGENLMYEWSLEGKDGTEFYLTSLSPMYGGDGEDDEVVGLVGIGRDVTMQKQAEKEIRLRNRELTLLNQVIAASARGVDTKAILETVCRELALAFDVPQAAAALLNPDKTEALVVAEYLAEGRPSGMGEIIPVQGNPSYEYVLTHKTPLLVEDARNDSRLAPVHDLMRRRGTISLLILPIIIDGEVAGSIALDAVEPRAFSPEEVALTLNVSRQVSGALERVRLEEAHRKLEEQYYQAQKMEAIGLLAGGIAHDFNNLLTVITGYSDFLLHGLQDNETLYRDVEPIKNAAERARGLTRQLLAFARRQVLRPQVLNLNGVITDMEKMLHRIIGEDIELVTRLDPLLHNIRADAGQVEQIIMNLAVNAHEAMPRGGRLTIVTDNVKIDEDRCRLIPGAKPGDFVCISVEDTGMGISEESLRHIFEPFFSTKDAGTGLGLAVVHGIVMQHEGWVNVYSEAGHGTTFRIYIPAIPSEEQPKPQDEGMPSQFRGSGERILLVEDEKNVREFATRALSGNGYVVTGVALVKDAMAAFEENGGGFDLVVSDVVLPDSTGLEMVEQFVSVKPDLKVLFSSGYTDKKSQWRLIQERGFLFLQKPYGLSELLRAVRESIERKNK